jgi:hypothetical protein
MESVSLQEKKSKKRKKKSTKKRELPVEDGVIAQSVVVKKSKSSVQSDVATHVGVDVKKKRKKKKKNKPVVAELPVVVVDIAQVVVPEFENVDAGDHCETPVEAYADIVVFLDAVAAKLGVTRATLRVYDPYYCAGGVVERLGSLGFSSVRNELKDCYSTWKDVEYDVLVTNPPYSGDHMERMCAVLAERKLPFAVLVPNFVVKKPYHKTLIEPLRPFFIVPRQRYVYLPPPGAREKKASDTHKKTSPFVSMWHCWGKDTCDEVWRKAKENKLQVDVCRSRNAVRDLRRK